MIDERPTGQREFEITDELLNVVRDWMDRPENRFVIEEGGYGDIESLIRAVIELSKRPPSPRQKYRA